MKCEFCGRDEALPFVCNYCGGVFCADHRLPEAHQCKGDLTQKRMVTPPPQTTFTWSDSTYAPQPQVVQGKAFSQVEIRDIAIAYFGLGLAFFISFNGGIFGSFQSPQGLAVILAISLIAVGPGFVLHELSHKFTARRYGHWAEFRMWPFGLLLALATSLIGLIFAAPGATYISGLNITKEENGRISIAGPLTNVVVALVFAPLYVFNLRTFDPWEYLGFFGVYINVFLAIFNMLPLMPLDGAKVFSWSKVRWSILFIPLLIIFVAFLLPALSALLAGSY